MMWLVSVYSTAVSNQLVQCPWTFMLHTSCSYVRQTDITSSSHLEKKVTKSILQNIFYSVKVKFCTASIHTIMKLY